MVCFVVARLLDQEVLLVEALRDLDDAVGLGCVDRLLDPSERACGLVYVTYAGTDDVKMREILRGPFLDEPRDKVF